MSRKYLKIGTKVTHAGYPGTVTGYYIKPDKFSAGMVDVRMPRGAITVSPYDLKIVKRKR